MTESENAELLTHTASLMNYVVWIEEDFGLQPQKDHSGIAIKHVDITECREEFCDELINTIVDWVYSDTKSKQIVSQFMATSGRSFNNAHSALRTLAFEKFRNRDGRDVFLQGQFGELVLFNVLQAFFDCVPLVRKMPITTSTGHERFGADAIHYKNISGKNIFMLGEVKTYTSDYRFKDAFECSLNSILTAFATHRKELALYVYDDFIAPQLIDIVQKYKSGEMQNAEVHLTCVVIYNETKGVEKVSQSEIEEQIFDIIRSRCNALDQKIFTQVDKGMLSRINYVIFPVWELDNIVKCFQKLIGK